LKLVIAMAGRGSRLAIEGSEIPKPLVSVGGRPMVAWALESLKNIHFSEMIFVILEEHERGYGISERLRELFGAKIIVIKLAAVSEGQLCTVMSAHDLIDVDEDLIVASADTYIVSEIKNDIAGKPLACQGIISVANIPGDRWSFARTDASGRVVQVAEKIRISDQASTGLYYFSNGRRFVQNAEQIIRSGRKMRGEYYVISVYEKYIEQGYRIDVSAATEMWDMGALESLRNFEVHLTRCGKATEILPA
jgi:NDP-sugar pyrophosphorylase family protein